MIPIDGGLLEKIICFDFDNVICNTKKIFTKNQNLKLK